MGKKNHDNDVDDDDDGSWWVPGGVVNVWCLCVYMYMWVCFSVNILFCHRLYTYNCIYGCMHMTYVLRVRMHIYVSHCMHENVQKLLNKSYIYISYTYIIHTHPTFVSYMYIIPTYPLWFPGGGSRQAVGRDVEEQGAEIASEECAGKDQTRVRDQGHGRRGRGYGMGMEWMREWVVVTVTCCCCCWELTRGGVATLDLTFVCGHLRRFYTKIVLRYLLIEQTSKCFRALIFLRRLDLQVHALTFSRGALTFSAVR